MAVFSSYAHGQFCWVDLMAHDIQAAQDFYGGLFEWDAAEQDTHGGPPYFIFRRNGQQVAGLGEMSAEMKSTGMPPIWNSYINVDDIQATTQKAAELGAQVMMPPFQVLQAGHMSIIQDTTGAAVSLWQKLDHCGAQLANEPGSWIWNDLMTRTPDTSAKFYSDLFGWTFEKDQNSPSNYWIVKNGGRMNAGMMEMTPEMGDTPPHWGVYFAVADIHAAAAQVKKLGGHVWKEPFAVGVGHIGVVADPHRGTFLLIQLTVPADPA